MPTTAERTEAVKLAEYLIAMKSSIGYGQVRPMQTLKYTQKDLEVLFASGKIISPDCTESITWIFKNAGMKDPTGFNFDGSGNTESMAKHLPHYTNPRDAHPGAIVVFGLNLGLSKQHGAMVMARNGADPLLFSHGSVAGPISIDFNAEARAHQGASITFLDIGSL